MVIFVKCSAFSSGAGTNLKGEHWSGAKWGVPIRRKVLEIFFVVPLHFFGSKSTISRFGEHFFDGQYSLVSFSFAVLYSRCPRAAV